MASGLGLPMEADAGTYAKTLVPMIGPIRREAEAMEMDLETMERRLAKAEHNVKLLSIVLTLVILVSAIRAKYNNPSRVQAPFQVVDERGDALLQVGESPDRRQSWLRLAQPGSEPNVVVYSGDDGHGLDLMEGDRSVAGLTAAPKRRGLALLDPMSGHAAWLSVAPDGGALTFTRQGADRGAVLGVTGLHGYLDLYDRNGKRAPTAP
jgi:hypothetical protein